MNNDFNYKPRESQRETGTTQSSSAPLNSSDTEEETSTTVSEPTGNVVTSPRDGSGMVKKLLKVLGILLLLALVAGGVYYWQHQKVTDALTSKKSAEDQVTSLKVQLAKQSPVVQPEPKTNPNAPQSTQSPDAFDVVSGGVSQTAGTAKIIAEYLPGKPTEVWVEYGTKPDTFSSSAKHVKATSEGTAGVYIDQEFDVTGLQAGTQYFYRAAGTVSGKTIYGGVVAFRASK